MKKNPREKKLQRKLILPRLLFFGQRKNWGNFKELMDKMQMEVDFQVQEKDGFLSLFVEGKDAGMLMVKEEKLWKP